VPATALATTSTVGQTGPNAQGCSLGNVIAARPVPPSASAYALPAGVITAWTTLGGTAQQAGSMKLKIIRPTTTANTYTVVGETASTVIPTGKSSTFVLAPGIAVKAGDLPGLVETQGTPVCITPSAATDYIGTTDGQSVDPAVRDPLVGSTFSFQSGQGSTRLNLVVTVESDNDLDGLGDDTQDLDDDNDGILDTDELALGMDPLKPYVPPVPPTPVPDTDADGVSDATDNCGLVANATQSNLDGDAQGDACDGDDDNDGLTDVQESALHTSSADRDSDEDGIGDAAEVARRLDPSRRDSDRDGLTDGVELGLIKGVADPAGPVAGTNPALFLKDRNPKTRTNPLKVDSDRDGLSDGREDRNRNGRIDRKETNPNQRDTDGDGAIDGKDHFPLTYRRR
jgi:hypothetical protein